MWMKNNKNSDNQQVTYAEHQQLSDHHLANAGNASDRSKVPMCELSPAETLKHMAEQHQHKSTIGMQFTRSPIHQNVSHQKQIHLKRPAPNDGSPFASDFHKINANEFNSVQFDKMLGGPAGMDNNIFDAQHPQQQQFRKSHCSQYSDGIPQSDLSLKTARNQPRNDKLSYPPQHSISVPRNMDRFVNGEQGTANCGASMDNNNDRQSKTLQMKQTQQMSIQHGSNPHHIPVS